MIQYPAIFHKISEMSVVYNVIFMILIFISNTETRLKVLKVTKEES